MENKLLSEAIADYALNLSLEDVPLEVQRYGKMLILDTLGVAMAAYNLEHASIVRNTVIKLNKTTESSLWGTKQKVSMADAVLANGSLVHGMDYDDTHVAAIVHPSACVVNTAISVGEAAGSSGKEIFNAIICGWEIMVRLGLAAKGGFHDRGYHATGIVGIFASACVAAKLLKLPKKVLVNALGICGSQSAALQEFLRDGSWVKKIHPGWASHSAIYSLLLAEQGFTGPCKVFEGEFGLWTTHLGTTDGLKECFADLGVIWRTKEIAVKLYPICHFIHSFVDCILVLRDTYKFTPDMVKRIECRIEPRGSSIVCEPIEIKRRPATDYAMRFSLPYCVAMAVLKGKVSPREIDENYINDQAVMELMDKVDCVIDESAANPGRFPGWVKVFLRDGNEYEMIQRCEKGTPENPINNNDIIKKYINNAEINLSQKKVENLMQKVLCIDELTKIDGLLEEMLIN